MEYMIQVVEGELCEFSMPGMGSGEMRNFHIEMDRDTRLGISFLG